MALQIPPNCDLTLGLTCIDKSTPGVTTWRARVDERFLNPAGVIQGGFLAAVMDSAMGASAVTAVGERSRQRGQHRDEGTRSFARRRPVTFSPAMATVLKAGRVVSFVEAKITDERGMLVATASSTYLIKERAE